MYPKCSFHRSSQPYLWISFSTFLKHSLHITTSLQRHNPCVVHLIHLDQKTLVTVEHLAGLETFLLQSAMRSNGKRVINKMLLSSLCHLTGLMLSPNQVTLLATQYIYHNTFYLFLLYLSAGWREMESPDTLASSDSRRQ